MAPRTRKLEQHHDQKKARNGGQHHRLAQIAHAHQRAGRGHHQPAVFEPDKRNEQADSRGDAALQGIGNRVHNLRAQAGQGDGDEENPRQQHRRQRLLPGEAESQRDGAAERVGEEKVFAHAGRQRYGVVGRRAPSAASRGGRRETGGREHGLEIHSRNRQHAGLHEDDVRHREEGGDAAQDFALKGRAVLLQLEEIRDGVHRSSHVVSSQLSVVSCRASANSEPLVVYCT